MARFCAVIKMSSLRSCCDCSRQLNLCSVRARLNIPTPLAYGAAADNRDLRQLARPVSTAARSVKVSRKRRFWDGGRRQVLHRPATGRNTV